MEEDQNGQKTVVNSQKPAKRGINMWKFISIILIIVLFGVGAYELGKGQFALPKASTPTAPTITVAPTASATTSASITPLPTSANSKKVSAGTKSQLFSTYTVTIPSDWAATHTANTASDTLTITKGQYVLTISQAAGGAGSCDYPGDTAEPMAQVFSNFVGITGTFSQFRRGTSDNKAYTVCEQKDTGFAFPTTVGYITYAVPTQADQATLAQMDGMVASLTK